MLGLVVALFPLARIVPAVFLVLVLGSCKTKPTPAPYANADAPDPAALLAATAPAVSAIAVPRARVKLGAHRGNLAFLAQSPDRFRGSVTIAGNEVVSLSVHERGYHLVYKLDALPTGYYEGPPAACAVSALLGVGLDAQKLVALVLGGAPTLEDYEVVSQIWDETRGREVLKIRNRTYSQDLAFAYDGGTWRFTEASLFSGETGARLWTVRHEELGAFDGEILPRRTILSRPGKRREEVVTIELREVVTNPPWAAAPPPATTTGEGSATTGPETTAADETDGGGDDGGWDDGGGEWEGAPGETPPPPEPELPPEPTPSKPPDGAAEPVPGRWVLSPGGLPARGDLCRGARTGN